jgi:hypoxanthine phosphoribosyltransferase
MKKIRIQDKEFKMFIPSVNIKRAIDNVAMQINSDYVDKEILFISILNGAFMFSADLIKKISVPCNISFVKLSSYSGSSSTGIVKEIIGLSDNIKGKHVIILEDIIDTGTTIESVVKQLKSKDPASVRVATMLFKPQAYLKNLMIDYIGLDIPNEFLVGYGLDYDGLGRNYEDIYAMVKK